MSYVFDGTDYITYPHSGGLTGFAAPLTNLSASVWVKWDGGTGSHVPFAKANAGQWYRVRPSITSAGVIGVTTRDNANGSGTSASGAISSGTSWQHLFFSFDKAGGASCWRIWLNGSEVSLTIDDPDAENLTIDGVLYVGARDTGPSDPFRGKIAELAMWVGETITDGTIASLYNSGSGALASDVKPTGLDFYARYLADANDSAGSLTGTVTGATLDAADHPVASGGGSTFVPRVIMVL